MEHQITVGRKPTASDTVLELIPSDRWIRTQEIHEEVNTSMSAVYQLLHRLLDKGKVERKLSLKDTRVKLYRRVA